MLNTFRTKIKFWSHFFLWPVILSFIAFYGWSFLDRPQEVQVAAVIGDVEIPLSRVTETRRRIHDYYRDVYQDNFEQFAANMDFNEMALEQLINEALLHDAAREFGVTVSRQDIQNSVVSVAAFQIDGTFSSDAYQAVLRRANMTPAQYESAVANDLKLQRTRALIGASASISDHELKTIYTQQNETIDCDYFLFRMPEFKDDVTDTDENIRSYYDDNSEEFRVGDQIKVNYIHFDPKTLANQVEVDEYDIEDYYEMHFDQYQQMEQVKARHILISVDRESDDESEEAAKARAVDLIQRINDGADFAELAREFSDCPSSQQGGDLGFFQSGQMDSSFEEAAWRLEINEMTQSPVRSQFGYHVIQKTDYQPQGWKSLEEVSSQIEQQIRSEEAKVLAITRAQNLFDQVNPFATRISELVEDTDLEMKTSDFFEATRPPREIGFSQNIGEILGNLEDNEISFPVETSAGVFLFEIEDRKDSYIPPFDDVTDLAKTRYVNWAATQLATEQAERVRNTILEGHPWDAAAEEFELTSENTGPFPRGSTIPRVGGTSEMIQDLFGLGINDISDVYTIRNNAVLFRISDKQEFDQKKFENELPKLRKQMLSTRQSQVISSWLEQKKSQMTRQGELTINDISLLR
jgi:peptidyl-prolyl cis-trans isomerase D